MKHNFYKGYNLVSCLILYAILSLTFENLNALDHLDFLFCVSRKKIALLCFGMVAL